MGKIVDATSSAVDTVNMIVSASQEQSASSEQIAKSVDSISAVANESATGVSQIAKSAANLSRLTSDLNSLLTSKFIIGQNDRSDLNCELEEVQ